MSICLQRCLRLFLILDSIPIFFGIFAYKIYFLARFLQIYLHISEYFYIFAANLEKCVVMATEQTKIFLATAPELLSTYL